MGLKFYTVHVQAVVEIELEVEADDTADARMEADCLLSVLGDNDRERGMEHWLNDMLGPGVKDTLCVTAVSDMDQWFVSGGQEVSDEE